MQLEITIILFIALEYLTRSLILVLQEHQANLLAVQIHKFLESYRMDHRFIELIYFDKERGCYYLKDKNCFNILDLIVKTEKLQFTMVATVNGIYHLEPSSDLNNKRLLPQQDILDKYNVISTQTEEMAQIPIVCC